MDGAAENMVAEAAGVNSPDLEPSGEGQQMPPLQVVPSASGYERAVKPILDRFFALALIVLLSPVIVTVALLVRLQLGRGVIYRQYRVGQHGHAFKMYKFRTMEQDRRRTRTGEAKPDRRSKDDRRQGALHHPGPNRRDEDRRGHDFGRRRTHKTRDDPRHTRLGRFLRSSSLDELPQLFNVLRGELSLVGPRPELLEVVAGYQDWQHGRHRVKPGITGLWQVTERADDSPMHEHVDTDLRYVENLSASLDLRILLVTLPALLGLGRGGRGS